MPTVACATLGCKVNQYETERILAGFAGKGFRIVDHDAPADVYVINTCSVTCVAESKSRKLIRKLAKQNPDALIVVTGCDAEMARIVGRTFPEAAVVIPNDAKLDIPEHVASRFASLPDVRQDPATDEAIAPSRVRKVIKVQDGCDMFCTYCSVPMTRGPVRSRTPCEIIEEVRSAAAAGHREIVLTGVLLGSYGRDLELGEAASMEGYLDLAALIRAVSCVDGVERIRLSSIEPPQVTERLLATAADIPAFCAHLHIPLQSGDDSVLQAMNRPYTSTDYRDLCRRAAEAIPDLAITTDVLVGFPGETDEAHRNTLAVVRDIAFSRIHVFRYSPRPLTPAASLPDQVPESVRAQRATEMMHLAREMQTAFANRHVGRTMEVLAEPLRDAAGFLAGYTSNYIRVVFKSDPSLVGRVVPVKLLRVRGTAVMGEIG